MNPNDNTLAGDGKVINPKCSTAGSSSWMMPACIRSLVMTIETGTPPFDGKTPSVFDLRTPSQIELNLSKMAFRGKGIRGHARGKLPKAVF